MICFKNSFIIVFQINKTFSAKENTGGSPRNVNKSGTWSYSSVLFLLA